MNAYSKKRQKRIARAEAMEEMTACAEHFDLIVLMTLHDEAPHFGAKRLKRFFRAFIRKYDEYKRRYLAADDSTVCGDREDTKQLKKQLKDIGFDYDAECEAYREEQRGGGTCGNSE